MSSKSARTMTERWLRRYRVLDAARGVNEHERPPRTFQLQAKHFGKLRAASAVPSPSDFHRDLCHRIRHANERVLLASLYVGPAASPTAHAKEAELLEALSQVPKHLQTQVLLDHNRALRPVPKQTEENSQKSATSSAQAVAEALAATNDDGEGTQDQEKPNNNNGLYLHQVLPSPWRWMLPNPVNEIAGVFHIKVYIVDDALILSGANLSEEYFTDRHDRYMCIVQGGGGLVDWYAQLVELLCEHSHRYDSDSNQSDPSISKDEFQRRLTEHLLEAPGNCTSAEELFNDPDTVALCTPTFQPREASSKPYRTDTQITNNVLDAFASEGSVKLSSAYLNPTLPMIKLLQKFAKQYLVSAGRISHGFKPKKKAGNKGKPWIPAVFDRLAVQTTKLLPEATLYHWEREGWTYHSKGIWLSSSEDDDLVAAMFGSGNYGERSTHRDLESNCVMVLAPTDNNPFRNYLQAEWDTTMKSTVSVDGPALQHSASLVPAPIRMLLPYLKSFF